MTKSDAALASATASDAARFLNHVDRSDECWEWRGALLPNGYGKFGLHGVIVTAHRFALTMKLGHPPRHQAIHSCDNPSCVNPVHLRDGTQVDNMADCRERGRFVPPPHVPGTANGNAVLSEGDVRNIRALAATGEGFHPIAHRYGVSPELIGMIVRRQAWRHI